MQTGLRCVLSQFDKQQKDETNVSINFVFFYG